MAERIRTLIFLGCMTGVLWWGASVSMGAAMGDRLGRVVRFSVYSEEEIRERMYFLPKPDAKPVGVQLQTSNRSEDYVYRGMSPLQLFTEAKGDDGRIKRRLMVSVDLPEKASEVFVLLAKNPDQGKGGGGAILLARVFDVSPQVVPQGKLVILNAAGMHFYAKVNERVMEVPLGVTMMVDAAHHTQVDLKIMARGRYYSSYSGAITPRKGERSFLLLLPPFYKGSPEAQVRLFRWGTRDDAEGSRGKVQNN